MPRAAIQLKQGIGRLIRSSGDRGVIALFDIRMLTKSYGQVFVKSLPPCRIVHSLDQIDTFLKWILDLHRNLTITPALAV